MAENLPRVSIYLNPLVDEHHTGSSHTVSTLGITLMYSHFASRKICIIVRGCCIAFAVKLYAKQLILWWKRSTIVNRCRKIVPVDVRTEVLYCDRKYFGRWTVVTPNRPVLFPIYDCNTKLMNNVRKGPSVTGDQRKSRWVCASMQFDLDILCSSAYTTESFGSVSRQWKPLRGLIKACVVRKLHMDLFCALHIKQ